MERQRTGLDIAMIVFGVIMLILTISLYGIVGAIVSANPIAGVFSYIQFGIASWYLLTSIFAIASGITGHKAPYITVIVLSLIAIFISLAGGIVAILGTVTNILGGSLTVAATTFTRRGSFRSTQDLYDAAEKVASSIVGLPWGIVVVDFLSFIFLIVISCVSCCGTCCNSTARNPPQTMVYASQPPGYVGQPPQHYVGGGTALNAGASAPPEGQVELKRY